MTLLYLKTTNYEYLWSRYVLLKGGGGLSSSVTRSARVSSSLARFSRASAPALSLRRISFNETA